jgi:hypothetical protein
MRTSRRSVVIEKGTPFLLLIGLQTTPACSGESMDLFSPEPASSSSGAGGSLVSSGSSGSDGVAKSDSAVVTTSSSSSSGAGGASGFGGRPTGADASADASAGGSGGYGSGGAAIADAAAAGEDGRPIVQGACAGKTRKVTIADLFISDFENGDLHGWYDYGAMGALHKLVIGSPGAAGTTKDGHLAAIDLTSFGAGMGFGTGCWDVSALDGISFWAKGTAGTDGTIQLQVAIPATHSVEVGGDCVSQCNDHPSKRVTLTPQWKQYTVAFRDLTQAGFGAPAKYGGIMMAVNWVSVSGPAVDFWVDEVALYSGTASPEPVGRGRSDAAASSQ